MIDTETVDNSFWYAIHTHPQQENRAQSNLIAWEVETFCPKIKEHRLNQFSGATTYLTKPLFPRYIFARFNLDQFLHKVCFTRGVHNVVSFGGIPGPVEDEIIQLLQSRVDVDGLVRMGEEFRPGDKVILRSGMLNNLVGVFERQMNDSDRVMILLATINYQGHIIVERELVRKAGK